MVAAGVAAPLLRKHIPAPPLAVQAVDGFRYRFARLAGQLRQLLIIAGVIVNQSLAEVLHI